MAGNKNSGRRAYRPSDEDREKVRVLKACGMSTAAIAEAVGVSFKTLQNHFSEDLEVGAAKVKAEVLMARHRSAMGGNVSAQNKMIEAMGLVPPPAPKVEKAKKMGKKEQLEIDAQTPPVDTSWGELLH